MSSGSGGYYFSDRPPPPKKKSNLYEPPKVDRTYLFMIILEYPPPPPPKADHCFKRSITHQNIAVCLLNSQSINQSASHSEQPRRLNYFVKAYYCYIKVVACPRAGGGGGGVTLIFSSYVWSGLASTVHPRN